MAVKVKIRNEKQIVVPIRFTRAVTGPTVIDAPDVDDRGFAPGTRPATWGSSDYRGPMVGITEGDTVRVKVSREDIDDAAPLFVTSSNRSIATVAAPLAGQPLGADGIIRITGVLDARNTPVKIQVRLGSATGPVLGELEPHIFQLHRLRVRLHLVTINGVATARTAASMVPVFQQINDIWRAAGIQFDFDPALTLNEAVNGFAVAGQMTTNLAASSFAEFSTLINLNPDNNRINIYCVRLANEVFGLTFANDTPRPRGFGIVIADNSTPNSNAHELCHYLDNPEHAHENAARQGVRTDIWARRRLLWTPNPYPNANPAHRNDVGYGAQTRGALISVKDLAGDPFDGETNRARRRSLNPN